MKTVFYSLILSLSVSSALASVPNCFKSGAPDTSPGYDISFVSADLTAKQVTDLLSSLQFIFGLKPHFPSVFPGNAPKERSVSIIACDDRFNPQANNGASADQMTQVVIDQLEETQAISSKIRISCLSPEFQGCDE